MSEAAPIVPSPQRRRFPAAREAPWATISVVDLLVCEGGHPYAVISATLALLAPVGLRSQACQFALGVAQGCSNSAKLDPGRNIAGKPNQGFSAGEQKVETRVVGLHIGGEAE